MANIHEEKSANLFSDENVFYIKETNSLCEMERSEGAIGKYARGVLRFAKHARAEKLSKSITVGFKDKLRRLSLDTEQRRNPMMGAQNGQKHRYNVGIRKFL